MINQKGLAHILLLLILGLGIIAGVYLVQHPQIFKPKATAESIEFLTSACSTLKDNNKTLTCPTVKFKLTSPLETGNALKGTESGFNLVKTAYAAGSGEGYYCKEDLSKIYHKKCEVLFNLSFLCSWPWWEDELKEKEEPCGDLRCVPTSADLFKQSATCAVVEDLSERAVFRPVISNQAVTPKPQPTVQPRSAADFLQAQSTPQPTIVARATATSTPAPATRATPSPTPTPTSSQVATPTPTPTTAAILTLTPTPVLNPTPTLTPGLSPGSSPTAIPTAVEWERTTLKYRFAENPTDLEKAQWSPYEAGGVEVAYDFPDPKPPETRSIYAQFLDNQNPGQIIKFSNGLDYVVKSIELISPPTPSPAVGPTSTPKPRATATPTVRPTSTPVPSAACDLQGDVMNWRNCPTKESLKTELLKLDPDYRDTVPNEVLILYENPDMKRIFSLKRISMLPGTILRNFPNQDLLDIAAASGEDTKTFLTRFDCGRISSFTQDIRDLFKTECGF